MSLLDLPAEILIQILDDVGSSYFRSDVSRLAVCKRWSVFARTVCSQDFHATQRNLELLQLSPNAEASLASVKKTTKTLDLSLTGFTRWNIPPSSTLGMPVRELRNTRSVEVRRHIWETDLNNTLIHLASTIAQSQKLRVLRIQAAHEQGAPPSYRASHDYLHQQTICSLLSASTLTCLELDLRGTRFLEKDRGGQGHVCTSIAALLPTLRRLRLHMLIICADVLKPLAPDTKLPYLSDVLVDLSVASPPECCYLGSFSIESFFNLQKDMEERAKALVALMGKPRKVRLLVRKFMLPAANLHHFNFMRISSTVPRLSVQELDVLTEETSILVDRPRWDDDDDGDEEVVDGESNEMVESY